MDAGNALDCSPFRRSCVTAVLLPLILLAASRLLSAQGEFNHIEQRERSASGTLDDSGKQIVIWIGPGAVSGPQPPIDRTKDTFLFLHAVPAGRELIMQEAETLHVTALSANGVYLNDDDILRIVELCPDLKTLVLSGPEVLPLDETADFAPDGLHRPQKEVLTADAWKAIATLKQLSTLKVSGHALTGASLQLFSGHPRLSQLLISDGETTDADLEVIAGIPKLEKLLLENAPAITGSGLASLAKLPLLNGLLLSGMNCDERFERGLRDYFESTPSPALRQLILVEKQVTPATAEAIQSASPFLKVCSSHVDVNQFVPAQLRGEQSIRYCRAMSHLMMSIFDVTLTGPSDATGRTRVTRAEIGQAGKRAGDAVMACLALMNGFTMLNLDHTNVTDDGLQNLGGMTSLEFLSLDGAGQITDRSVDRILRLHNLKALSVDQTHLSDEGVSRLCALPKLEMLQAGETAAADQTATAIAASSRIRWTILSGCAVTDLGAELMLENKRLELCELGESKLISAELQKKLKELNQKFRPESLPPELHYAE